MIILNCSSLRREKSSVDNFKNRFELCWLMFYENFLEITLKTEKRSSFRKTIKDKNRSAHFNHLF